MLTHLIAAAGLLLGTATDIDHREVPDWINYTLITAGLILASITALHQLHWQPIITSLLGLAAGYLLGALMYYTGQWGGGDAKMLMGLGALLGIPAAYLFGDAQTPLLIYFLIALVFAGAAYGMLWMLILFIRQRKKVLPALKNKLSEPWMHTTRKISITTLLALLVITLVWTNIYLVLILVLAAISYTTLLLALAVKAIEETCFIKQQPVDKLVIGDWIVKDVKKNNQTIIPADNTGLTHQQLQQLKKHDITEVTIKEGIPFVPSFLLAYAAAYIWWSSEAGIIFWI